MAYFWPGSTYDRQSRIAQSSQRFDQVHGTPLSLQGKDALPPGESTLDTRRPIGYSRPPYRLAVYDANSGNAFLPEQAIVAAPCGHATLASDLPPRSRPRSVDLLSFVDASEFWFFGTDAVTAGAQRFDLPPRAAARARDYTYVDPSEVWLFGTDALVTGKQSTALPPIAALRTRDYSLTASFPLSLISKDAVNAGQQLTELPPRAAQRARDYSWSQELIPDLVGQDSMAVGQQSTALVPAPAPLRARDYTLAEAFPLTLNGQDALNAGQQLTVLPPTGPQRAREYTWAPPISINLSTIVQVIPYGQQVTDTLPPRAAARLRDYTWSQSLVPVLVSQDAMATGEQWLALPSSPAPLRARDYSVTEAFPLSLISQDSMLAGAQNTLLPPVGALRARDYSFTPPINLPVLTTVVQVIPYGQQLTDSLPPHSASRARDYTWSQELIPTLIGQDAMATGQQSTALAPSPAPLRAKDYSLTKSFPLSLIGQDALNAGQQSTALPPIAALRARDYTFAPPINLPCLTTVVQQIPYGAQLTDSLPPRAVPRLRDYTWSQDLVPNLIGQDQLNAGQQLTALVPSPAPLRARDYSLAKSFPLTLISQDAVNAGDQFTALPPIASLRSRDYSFVPPINLSCLTTVVQQIPYGQQSTDNLPARAPSRARDYTFTAAFPLTLNGQDAMVAGDQFTTLAPRGPQRAATLTDPLANLTIIPASTVAPPGQQSFELAPKAAPRIRDYTFLHPTDQQLIGKDAVNPGKSTFATDLPPKGPQRARDYTWLQTYPLYIFEQLPTGDSTFPTEGPPKGPLRAKDYTFFDVTKQNLIGQDSMTVGQSWLDADNLPPRAYARLRDYSWLQSFSLPELRAAQKVGHHAVSDRALFIHSLSDRALFTHTLTDRADFLHTDSSQEQGG